MDHIHVSDPVMQGLNELREKFVDQIERVKFAQFIFYTQWGAFKKYCNEKGVQLIVCTTCLNHFKLMDKLQVGDAGGMKEIVEAQWQAQKVITL